MSTLKVFCPPFPSDDRLQHPVGLEVFDEVRGFWLEFTVLPAHLNSVPQLSAGKPAGVRALPLGFPWMSAVPPHPRPEPWDTRERRHLS